ncbi:hypothetical protein C8F04DRAFT_1137624, partial [Mycena alexandri]
MSYPRYRPRHTFRQREPLLGDQAGRFTRAFEDLVQANREGKLLSWDHEITHDWEHIPRPQRRTSSGLVDIAATGFKKIWPRTESPFFCPHTRNNGRPYKALVLRIGGLLEGGTADYFHATDHQCAFRVVVKPLKEPAQVVLTWEDQRAYLLEQQQEDQRQAEETDDEYLPSSQSTSTSSLTSTSTSSSSARTSTSSSASTSSTISRLAVEAMVSPNPRWTPQDPSGPRPTPTPLAAAGPAPLRSFYSARVANARRTADIETMDYLHNIHAAGILKDEPSAHPAWNQEEPHPLLHLYDQRIYAHCLRRTNNYLDHLYTSTGQVIRELNSVYGIPYADYTTLVRETQLCDCCKNQFTPDGYNAHVRDGRCTNHPELAEVEECSDSTALFKMRSFRDARRPKENIESLDTSVGAAFLEWNSRLGIPTDVWLMVSTAIVHCDTCDLVRSIPAHLNHLHGGVCSDPGQSVTPTDV